LRIFFGQGGCGRPHFLVEKTLDFSTFMVCPYGQGELSHCGQFVDGSLFRRFCAESLMTVQSVLDKCEKVCNIAGVHFKGIEQWAVSDYYRVSMSFSG